MIQFPYDFRVIDHDPDWRSKLYWPVSYRETRDTALKLARGLIKAGSSFADDRQHWAYIASLRVLAPWAIAVVEAAQVVSKMKGEDFASDLPEVQYLAGRTNANPAAQNLDQLVRVVPCRRPLARQLAWTAQWSSPWRLPYALARPEVIAFNRNPGLIYAARASKRRIRYDNVERIYRDAVNRAPQRSDGIAESESLSELISRTLRGLDIDNGAIRERSIDLLLARYEPVLTQICDQLQALERVKSLPSEVWAGTGGYWPSRIVGIEIMRRGGCVRRFDHGGNKALIRNIEQTTFVEAAVSTHFVFSSDECAQRWTGEPLADLLGSGHVPQWESLPPAARGAQNGKLVRVRSSRVRPRVMYASGQLKGFWQILPSSPPNLVYLDWMLRLTRMLQLLPIDLVCRPHPGGIFAGRRHPLSLASEIPSANFESLLDDVDIIVIDSPFTRAMCAALKSTKPIIYLDPGHDYFCDVLLPLVRERCTIIDLTYDDRGLPQVDVDTLATSIAEAKQPDEDIVRRFNRLFSVL